MRNLKQPCTIEGIEFDALIDEQKEYSSTIPQYPVEDGYSVSDGIILDPIALKMTLYITDTPVTWLQRHGLNRVESVCAQIENLWAEKKLVKVVTNNAIYTNMGIVGCSIKRSKDIGYAREISLTLKKVRFTTRSTVNIPDYVLKSGETNANAGVASTSLSSAKSGTVASNSSNLSFANEVSASTGSTAMNKAVSAVTGKSAGGSSATAATKADSKRGHSILYGIAEGLNWTI